MHFSGVCIDVYIYVYMYVRLKTATQHPNNDNEIIQPRKKPDGPSIHVEEDPRPYPPHDF